MSFSQAVKEENLAVVQKIMHNETSAGYQVYNPFVMPVLFKRTTMLGDKVDSLKYSKGMFDGYKVADLGCSMGYFAFRALGYGAEKVVGYDQKPFYVEAGNAMASKYAELFPKTKGKISFKESNLSSLPKLEEDFDVLIVNSLIHWFIMFKKATFEECVDWMYDNCRHAVYFEGCMDSSEKVMQDHGVPADLMDIDKFKTLLEKKFSKVVIIGKTTYNDKRHVIRLFK